MKKRLLFAFAMLLSVTAGFAQNVGDYVYTKQGKFKITADKISGIVNSEYAGWQAVSAAADAVVADQFVYSADEPVGFKSQKGAPAEGMSYALSGIDAASTYVVTFTIAQPNPGQACHRTIHNWTCDHIKGDNNDNILNIVGEYIGETEVAKEDSVKEYATPTEVIPGEAQTYSYAIVGDGLPRAYSITLKGWADDLIITDIKVQEAQQVGDERLVAPYLDHAKQLVNLKEWEESEYLEGLVENIEAAEEVLANADTTPDDIDGALEGLKETIADFQKYEMDDFLTGNVDKIPLAPSKVQKVNNIGIWEGFSGAGGRIHANAGGYYDAGHYAGNTKWGFGKGCLGLTTKMNLKPGSYIFSMQQRAVSREKSTSTCWDENTGLSCAYAVMYVRPVGDETAEANIVETDAEYEKSIAVAYSQYNLPADKLEKHTISFNITEEGLYEFAVKTYAQEHYKDMANGGTFEPFDAQIYAKTEGLPLIVLQYIEDVKEQIGAARSNITKATDALANQETPWGKGELKAAIDVCEPITAAYEAMTDEQIIATYFEDYSKDKGLEAMDEDSTFYYRGLASEVYRTAAKGIIAANNQFTAKNDTLASLGKAIAAAEENLAFRIYDKATGKADLVAAVADAKSLDTQMRAADYSEENAAAILAMIARLNDAAEVLKTSIPESAITVLADINFDVENPGLTDAAGEVVIAGTVGSMQIANFTRGHEISNAWELGYPEDGETLCPGVLHVGDGEGLVELEVPADAYGTDVVRISMDWWFGSLTGKYAGFYLRTAADDNLGGFYFSPYNNVSEYDPLDIRANGYSAKGRSGVDNTKICMDDNYTHMEYILDYGNRVAYAISNIPAGVKQTAQVKFGGETLAKFVLKSNYNNYARRCWFDNLKIERIAADPATAQAIHDVVSSSAKAGKIYTISGIEVKSATKGVYIINGKKVIK